MTVRDEAAKKWVPPREVSEASVRAVLSRHERLTATGQTDAALDREMASLLEALADRAGAGPRTDPRAPLYSVFDSWDLFKVQTQKSHRSALVGTVIGFGKKAALASLKPLNAELLRPQRTFNQVLAQALREATRSRTKEERALLSMQVRHQVEPLSNPAAFRVRTHREGALGQATVALKKWSVSKLAPGLEPSFERLARFNEAAVAALQVFLGESTPSLRAVHAMVGNLRELTRPAPLSALSGVGRAAWPMWVELLRRQETFALAVTATIGALFGIPRHHDDAQDGYPQRLAASEAERAAVVDRQLQSLRTKPTFSIITPTYRTPPELLRACVESVRAQTYPHWELVLADDGSSSPALEQQLRELAATDSRIHVHLLGKNQGIAGATNSAIEKATGDFCAFLDHDDVLAPTALAEIALRVDEKPDTDVLYCDEDQLDFTGRRTRPFFKPAWSPELLRSVNYVCHFLVARRTLVASVGGIRRGFDGAQDYDFILRLSERTSRFEHLPHVLYHWRMAPNSTAADINNKPEAKTNGMRALEEHLQRTNQRGTVRSPIPTHYEVEGAPPEGTLVTLIVLAHEHVDLGRLVGATVGHHQVLVASRSPQPTSFDSSHAVWLQSESPLQAAVAAARGEIVVVVHDDVRCVEEDWLQQLAAVALRPEVGLAGPKVLHADGYIQNVGYALTREGPLALFAEVSNANEWTSMGHSDWAREVGTVGSCAFAFRRALFTSSWAEAASSLESMARLSQAVRAQGLRVVVAPASVIEHLPHDRCPDLIATNEPMHDTFYNPHLSLQRANGGLAESLT